MKISIKEKKDKLLVLENFLKEWKTYKEIKKIWRCWDNLIIEAKNNLRKKEEILKDLGKIFFNNSQNFELKEHLSTEIFDVTTNLINELKSL
jgi:Zn-finger protein